MSGGLPSHIGPRPNLLLRSPTQSHLARRRAMRPEHEYQPVTDTEWTEFEEHFDKRKLELGNCGRPYATPCSHEHACFSELTDHAHSRCRPNIRSCRI